MKQMNKKTLKKVHVWVRAVIQLLYFLFIPSAYTAAFNGVKYIFTQMGAKSHLELTSFVVTLIALCLFTVVFGRFFCGFACAFGSLGDAVRAFYVFICKKRKKKPVTMKASVVKYLQAVKYIVLVLLVVSCYTGVYSKTQGMSPWDVFSMLHAGNFKLGGYIVGLVLLVLILVGMAFQERFFCRVLCPDGRRIFYTSGTAAVYPAQRPFRVYQRLSCMYHEAPSDIELAPDTAPELSGDCFQCQKCIDTCPKGNIHTGIRSLKGNEIWFTVLRAVVLLVLFKFIGL